MFPRIDAWSTPRDGAWRYVDSAAVKTGGGGDLRGLRLISLLAFASMTIGFSNMVVEFLT